MNPPLKSRLTRQNYSTHSSSGRCRPTLHVTLHWDWVIRTTRKLLSPRGHDKVIWLVNLALLVAMTFCVASGILISRVALPSLGINPLSGPFWEQFHFRTADVTLALVPVHAALRWRWIAGVGRRLLTRRPE